MTTIPPTGPPLDNATVHELPSGGKVWLRNAEHLRGRDVKAVIREVNSKVDGDNLIEVMIAMAEALMKVMVVAWELPYSTEDERDWAAPSVDATVIDDLEAGDYNRLRALMEPITKIVMPNVSAPEKGTPVDPDSPTPPANG